MNKIIILMMVLFTLSLSAKVNKMTILDFDNNSGVRKYNSLGKGLADMLTTDLTYVKGLRIVEREKLRAIMREMNLSKSKYISRKSMLKLGKGLAANWILKGSFVTMKGRMRIDISIMSTETGEIVDSASVEGWVTKFFDLEKRLIRRIIKAVHTKENRITYIPQKKKEVKDFKAVLQYSKGVKLYDEGKFIEAKEAFREVKKFDNKFDYSDKYLKALEERIKKYKKSDEYKKEQEKKKMYKDFMKNFVKSNKDTTTFGKIVMISSAFQTDKKFSEAFKFLNFVKKNVSKKNTDPTTYNLIIPYLQFQEINLYVSIKNAKNSNKEINKEEVDKVARKILKLSETFINEYPDSRYKSSVVSFMETILEEKKEYKKDKEKYEKELIEKAKKYSKDIKKIKKEFKKKLKSSNLKSNAKYRRNDIERELKRRADELELEKRNKLNKKILVLNENIHKLRIKYYKNRSKKLEKKLKDFPLKLKKNSLMSLISSAKSNWKYEEVRKVYKSLVDMKNLKDSERLDCYEYMIDNYLNEAKYKPEQYKKAKKFYESIRKNLNLNFYREKYIKSKSYLKDLKDLNKGNHELRIEKLKKDEKIAREEGKAKRQKISLINREIYKNEIRLRKLKRIKKASVNEKNELSTLMEKNDKLKKKIKTLELERDILSHKEKEIKEVRYDLDREWDRLRESTKETLKEFERIQSCIEDLEVKFE